MPLTIFDKTPAEQPGVIPIPFGQIMAMGQSQQAKTKATKSSISGFFKLEVDPQYDLPILLEKEKNVQIRMEEIIDKHDGNITSLSAQKEISELITDIGSDPWYKTAVESYKNIKLENQDMFKQKALGAPPWNTESQYGMTWKGTYDEEGNVRSFNRSPAYTSIDEREELEKMLDNKVADVYGNFYKSKDGRYIITETDKALTHNELASIMYAGLPTFMSSPSGESVMREANYKFKKFGKEGETFENYLGDVLGTLTDETDKDGNVSYKSSGLIRSVILEHTEGGKRKRTVTADPYAKIDYTNSTPQILASIGAGPSIEISKLGSYDDYLTRDKELKDKISILSNKVLDSSIPLPERRQHQFSLVEAKIERNHIEKINENVLNKIGKKDVDKINELKRQQPKPKDYGLDIKDWTAYKELKDLYFKESYQPGGRLGPLDIQRKKELEEKTFGEDVDKVSSVLPLMNDNTRYTKELNTENRDLLKKYDKAYEEASKGNTFTPIVIDVVKSKSGMIGTGKNKRRAAVNRVQDKFNRNPEAYIVLDAQTGRFLELEDEDIKLTTQNMVMDGLVTDNLNMLPEAEMLNLEIDYNNPILAHVKHTGDDENKYTRSYYIFPSILSNDIDLLAHDLFTEGDATSKIKAIEIFNRRGIPSRTNVFLRKDVIDSEIMIIGKDKDGNKKPVVVKVKREGAGYVYMSPKPGGGKVVSENLSTLNSNLQQLENSY